MSALSERVAADVRERARVFALAEKALEKAVKLADVILQVAAITNPNSANRAAAEKDREDFGAALAAVRARKGAPLVADIEAMQARLTQAEALLREPAALHESGDWWERKQAWLAGGEATG